MDLGYRLMPTWAQRSQFKYEGSVNSGTIIHYGEGFKFSVEISRNQYQRLLAEFASKEVPIGTSRDHPPEGSVGEWLIHNVTPTALASYVGNILVYEGYASKERDTIRFF